MPRAGPPVFKAWMAFFVVANVLGAVAGVAIGALVGVVLATGNVTDVAQLHLATQVVGFVIGLPISCLVFHRVVTRMIIPKVWPPERPPGSGGGRPSDSTT